MLKIKKENLRDQLYFFRIVFTIVDLVTNSFYYILLFKVTNQFTPLFIDMIIYFLAQWIGLIIGSVIIPRFGYIKIFKAGFFFHTIAMILLIVNINNLVFLYPIFAVLRSFPRGLYWAVNNNYLLKELPQKSRSMAISDMASITYILQIVLPVLIGSTVTLDGNYSILFIIAGSISFVSLFFPWKYNKKPKTHITISEINNIIRNKKFNSFGTLLLLEAGFNACFTLSFAIVPYLLIKNEFGVGALLSLINLIAAIFAFMERSKKAEKVKIISYFGTFISGISNIIFVLIWSFPALIFRSIFSTLGDSLYTPFIDKLDLNIRDKILGNNINQSSSEMIIVVETIFTVGRVLFLLLFLFLLVIINDNESIFKIIIAINGFWVIYLLSSFMKLDNSKRKTINLQENITSENSNPNSVQV